MKQTIDCALFQQLGSFSWKTNCMPDLHIDTSTTSGKTSHRSASFEVLFHLLSTASSTEDSPFLLSMIAFEN